MEGDIEDEMGKSLGHFIAGAVAGTAEHCGMFPIDTIKTHMQANRWTQTNGLQATTRHIIREGGFKGLFRGLPAVVAGAAPAHAIYFASYEAVKSNLSHLSPHNTENPLIVAIAGITATILNDAVLTPMDTIKQKRQLNYKQYSSTINCFKRVVSEQGFKALYAGYTTTIVMNVPFHAVYFNIYEYLRRVLKGSNKEFSSWVHLTAGAGAGMVASAITNPLDVAKTRLQTQGEMTLERRSDKPYNGLFKTVKAIAREEGVRGFSKGIAPRMIFHSFSASILWTTYEYGKFLLGVE